MPIEDVALFPVTTPRLSGVPSQHVLVRLRAKDGTVGWGEMSDLSHLPAMMPAVADLEACLHTVLVGCDAMNLNALDDVMRANFPGERFYGKACLVRAGVSIAAHDLKARLLEVPVYDLLGGRRRERVPVCFPIFRMRSRDAVADRRRLVHEAWDQGFRAFRFYFGHDTEADEELLDALCGEYGAALTLTSLDGSGLFTLPAFLHAYRRLHRFPFGSVESPVERTDVESMAEARRAIDHPVSEHVRSMEYALRLIKHRAVDIFNVSITIAGGIHGMLELFALARAANLECLIGTTQELSIATAAQAHGAGQGEAGVLRILAGLGVMQQGSVQTLPQPAWQTQLAQGLQLCDGGGMVFRGAGTPGREQAQIGIRGGGGDGLADGGIEGIAIVQTQQQEA